MASKQFVAVCLCLCAVSGLAFAAEDLRAFNRGLLAGYGGSTPTYYAPPVGGSYPPVYGSPPDTSSPGSGSGSPPTTSGSPSLSPPPAAGFRNLTLQSSGAVSQKMNFASLFFTMSIAVFGFLFVARQ